MNENVAMDWTMAAEEEAYEQDSQQVPLCVSKPIMSEAEPRAPSFALAYLAMDEQQRNRLLTRYRSILRNPQLRAHASFNVENESAQYEALLRIWSRRDLAAPVIKIGMNIVSVGDLCRLQPPRWLNEEIISAYLQLIKQRNLIHPSLPRIYIASTYLFAKVNKRNGYKRVLRWTRKIDIFNHDLILFPVFHLHHWALCAVDLRGRSLTYYDSWERSRHTWFPWIAEKITEYLCAEFVDKKGKMWREAGRLFKLCADVPYQPNNHDCGPFMLMNAAAVAAGETIEYGTFDGDAIRRKIGVDLLRKRLPLKIAGRLAEPAV